MSEPLARRFARYAPRTALQHLPAPVVHEAKRRFIDSFATAVGAMDAEAYAIARRCALRVSAQPRAPPARRRHVSSVEWATFVNGLLIRYLDLQRHLPVAGAGPPQRQPRGRCWPSARRSAAGGKDLITAAVLAYEIQCRLCDAASLRKHGVDHVTYGAISSALAAVQADGARRGADDARRRHRRRVQRRPAADARRRAEHVEGLRLRQRRPQRRLRRDCWPPRA